jgi:hypothetical protein
MRQALFSAAAARAGQLRYDAKRADRSLSRSERRAVEASYRAANQRSIRSLSGLFVRCVQEADYEIGREVETLRVTLRGLLGR